MVKVIKKYKKEEDYDFTKIKTALQLASERAGKTLDESISDKVQQVVENNIKNKESIKVQELHTIIEYALKDIDEDTYIEYLKYNDYKHKFPFAFNDMLQEGKRIVFSGDKENANKNSAINSTQKEILGGLVSEQIMLNYELKHKIAQAHNENWIYIHDLRDRFLFNNNCCLFDLASTLKDGFTLNGIEIEEADTLETAFDQVNDIIMCASSQQYGGFTLANIDETMGVYVEKSWKRLRKENPSLTDEEIDNKVYKATKSKIKMLEYKINCVNNALGQTPFVTWSLGLGTDKYSKMVAKAILETRINKLGKKKDIAIFPKLVFLHRNEINGLPTSPNYDLKQLAIKCSMECMYPDWLSLDSGYLKEVYDRCQIAISPMGCRAFLSPWFDEQGNEKYIGRFNIGAITMILPKYAIESKGDIKKFYKIIDKYMDMIVKVHEFTYRRMANKKASSNPLFFCEGGCVVKLKPNDTIEKALECATASFGIIGLEEAIYSLTGKHLHENNQLAIEIMQHIQNNIDTYKKEYNRLYAYYMTPSEGLCDKALKKDLKKYGIIEGVTDKEWYTNSFHVDVRAKVDAITKMNIEKPMFDIATGGRIFYSEIPDMDNPQGLEDIINQAMKRGLYYGVNFEKGHCYDCGAVGEFPNGICTECGSTHILVVDRVCGYLGIKELDGETRYNDGKSAETQSRVKHYDFIIENGLED